jgi:hypothetical protein
VGLPARPAAGSEPVTEPATSAKHSALTEERTRKKDSISRTG